MEATVAILARIPKGEGYRLATLKKKRGSFIKPEDALCYYLRYTDAATRKRVTVPAGEDFSSAVVKALNIGNNQSAIRNGQEAAPQVTTKAERLTAEINAMLSAATVDEADLIKFLLETGVRDKEAAHAEWDDIDGNYLHLKDKPKYDWRLKDKEIRSVPLNSKLIARLRARRLRQEAQAKEDGRDVPSLIFPNSLNRPNLALDETIQRVVAKARKAGFEWNPRSEVTMHKFRKTFATKMYRATKDIKQVRDWLGHSDIATTELYVAADTHPDAKALELAFAAFGN